jgi:toxin HigB-1
MIVSFGSHDATRLFDRHPVRRFPPFLQRLMLRKLLLRKLMLRNAAVALNELRVPPGNRLEKRRSDRAGQHSIRVNAQWRLWFRCQDGAAQEVEIVDYHGT